MAARFVRPFTVDDTAFIAAASNVPETDYAAWAVGTTYAAQARVIRINTNYHKVFESLVAGNVGHDPQTDDGTHWVEVGATNRWRMFDGSKGAQTTHADSITAAVQTVGRITTLACLNVSAATARLVMTDAVEGVVYDQTRNLQDDSGILDGWRYAFEPIIRKDYALFDNLPPYAAARLDLTFTDTGATAACGEVVMGLGLDMGNTQWGTEVGIQDYSVKSKDDFGVWTIVERGFNDYATMNILVQPGMVDFLKKTLAEFRAQPALYIGDPDYGSMIVYGFFTSLRQVIAYPTLTQMALEVDGLP